MSNKSRYILPLQETTNIIVQGYHIQQINHAIFFHWVLPYNIPYIIKGIGSTTPSLQPEHYVPKLLPQGYVPQMSQRLTIQGQS